MNEQLFSTYWYRVANLKPFLRNTTIISRHVYREEPWYVLQNSLNGRSHRFNAPAYALIGQMDGQRTVEEIWENAGHVSADAAPTQDEFIRLLGRLHDADLVQSDILPSTMESVRKSQTGKSGKLKKGVSNPFSIRLPLFDPDWFLEKWQFLTAPVFTLPAFITWLIVVTAAMGAAIVYGTDLVNSISDRLFNTNTLLMLWLTYPLVKLLHEFGHAWAIKNWGGEIHEMGIKLIAFTPIPYVDASASAAFSEKRHRIMVAAIGMMIELFLASIALFVWLNVETGFVSAVAYSVMMVSGISTVLFNGNPLLQYDGYYILSDLIEIPNLAQRSTRYLGYLIQRYIFRVETAESPATAHGEETWFAIYGPIAFCYRIMIMVWLIWMFSERFFLIGIGIAVMGVVSLLILPAFRKLIYFLSLPAIKNKRLQVITLGTGAVIGISLLLFVVPMPFWTTAQGVVWLPEQSAIRPGTDCEIVEIVAPIDQAVKKDTHLLSGIDPLLESEIELYLARLEELHANYNATLLQKRVERRLIVEEIKKVKG
ncbi:MAG: PqqD family protein, partial [Gammaproteobacteria bacterium]|nr:PqqD family protein [Gammaproteobacteria bacterium]